MGKVNGSQVPVKLLDGREGILHPLPLRESSCVKRSSGGKVLQPFNPKKELILEDSKGILFCAEVSEILKEG